MKATNLKEDYPHLTVTLAIGGWNEGSTKYSEMSSDPLKREIFVNSVIQFTTLMDWTLIGNILVIILNLITLFKLVR